MLNFIFNGTIAYINAPIYLFIYLFGANKGKNFIQMKAEQTKDMVPDVEGAFRAQHAPS